MSDYKLYLGSHIGMGGPAYYEGTVKEALSYDENTFMFYTGAPQNTRRTATSLLHIEEGRKILQENGIDESKLIVHAPYIINLGNTLKPDTYDLAVNFLIQELRRVQDFHVSMLVLHPGSHLGEGFEKGAKAVVEGLDYVLERDGTNVKIALETMAGKGGEIGRTFEEVAYILNNVKHKERLGVCLDTCHINDGGYDVADVDGTLEEFDRVIGLDKLLCVHVNDSKNERDSHKDRHDNLGYGTIGFETILKWVKHPLLNGVPKVLETPWVGEKAPYKKEIEMLRSGVYEEDWRENL